MPSARLYLGNLDAPDAYLAMTPVGHERGLMPLLWLAMFASGDAEAGGDMWSTTVAMAQRRLEQREALLRSLVRNIGEPLTELRALLTASACRFVVLDLAGVRRHIGAKFFDVALQALDDPQPLGIAAITRCTALLKVVAPGTLDAVDQPDDSARRHLIGDVLGQGLPCENFPLPVDQIPVRPPPLVNRAAMNPVTAKRWILLHATGAILLAPAFLVLAVYESGSRRWIAGLVAAGCAYLAWALMRARGRAVWGYVWVGMSIIGYQFARAITGTELGLMHLAPGACILVGYWTMREVLNSRT